MSDDAVGPGNGQGPETWKGVPIPPRPPLPVPLPEESETDAAQPAVPAGTPERPAFIGLPPGMEADIDTVPATGAPPVPVRPQTAPPEEGPSDFDLEFEDGAHVPLRKGVLIGRDPSAQSAYPDAELVSVTDLGRSVSKTHAAVQWSRGAVWVTDLNSTNGTRVIDENGRETVCVPEAPTPVPAGGGILFGVTRATLRARLGDGCE
ncbi:FHA domain-containing protein [Paramicrobacterium sp. CJ85]|uniref:FHA domain-containing protein n=1 Tax=Paramicrobacterium sp. CJ85 TaxID=3445355 RepID=UPI003F621C1C